MKFAGYIVSQEGVSADPDKIRAIVDFPSPENLTDLRAFFGLANQLGQFLPDLAHTTQPLRGLLKRDAAFLWLPEHEQAFGKTKKILTSPSIIHHFDSGLKSELLTDASRLKGLGFALIQYADNGKIRLIQCGSRSLTDTESRYATIELEMLGISWAIKKCRIFLAGTSFSVITDHKPLISIINRKSMNEVHNPRVQRLLEKVAGYDFSVSWTPGKTHRIADALSRAPTFKTEEGDLEETILTAATKVYNANNLSLAQMKEVAKEDKQYQEIIHCLTKGQNVNCLPHDHPARAFKSIWTDISIEEELLIWGQRIIVPKELRNQILEALHKPHSGTVKTRAAAKELYYWPGMNNEIQTMIEKCDKCQELRPSLQKEALLQSMATKPMDSVSVDLFDYGGRQYLVMVDRYSGFTFVDPLSKATSAKVIVRFNLS